MEAPPRSAVTETLLALGQDQHARTATVNRLFELAYDQLRGLAAAIMRGERPDHTLQPTALVHEAYCRLIDDSRVGWQDRAHFIGIAARAMRQVLVDHARRRAAAKRGGSWQRLTFDERLGFSAVSETELLDLDGALGRLGDLDERMARVVELRVFGGLTAHEIGHLLGVTRRTVQRDWRVAKMWLSRELAEGGGA